MDSESPLPHHTSMDEFLRKDSMAVPEAEARASVGVGGFLRIGWGSHMWVFPPKMIFELELV
jgi:hypothetical protein